MSIRKMTTLNQTPWMCLCAGISIKPTLSVPTIASSALKQMRFFLFVITITSSIVSWDFAFAQQTPAMKNNPQTETSVTPTASTSALPLFYKELVPFDKTIHRALKAARTPDDYTFAIESDVIPLVFNEVAFAAMHYPIVFLDAGGAGGVPTLAAIVGSGNRKNRFIDARGQWSPGIYVPAWVRRYPFFAMKIAADGQPLLGVDTTASRLKSSKSEPLLDQNGNPTQLLQEILAMNIEYQQAGLRTNQLADQLQKSGLLEPVVLQVQASTKESQPEKSVPSTTIGGFLVINDAKLANLDKEKVAELHKTGALSLAYAHLISMQHLRKLFENASN
jgi:hypothetical protein